MTIEARSFVTALVGRESRHDGPASAEASTPAGTLAWAMRAIWSAVSGARRSVGLRRKRGAAWLGRIRHRLW